MPTDQVSAEVERLRFLGRAPEGEKQIATLCRELINKNNVTVLSGDDLSVPLIDPTTGQINVALLPDP